jgi:7-cyano-7-deazaguanine synthase
LIPASAALYPAMPAVPNSDPIGVLFSGGLDSSILLGLLLDQGRTVQPLYVDSGLFWQAEEQRAMARYLARLAQPRLSALVTLNLPLDDLYGNHWSITGRNVPDAESPDEAVYLPGRNPLLLVKTRIWCHLHGVKELSIGSLSSNPFADAGDLFFRDFEASLDAALGKHVALVRPLAGIEKRRHMQLGRKYPLELTFSCLAPTQGLHCGRCNKCAERQKAFREGGIPDPTDYASPIASGRQA